MFFIQCNDGLFPGLGLAAAEAGLARLAFAVLRVYVQYLDIEQLFHSPANIVFSSQPVDFEGIGIVAVGLVHAFFSDQRPENNLARFQCQLALCDVSAHRTIP